MDPYYSATLTVSQGRLGCEVTAVLMCSNGRVVAEERMVWPLVSPILVEGDGPLWLRRALTHLVRDYQEHRTTYAREYPLVQSQEARRG